MMMLYRLVRLIEAHSQSLATSLRDQVESCELTPSFHKNVPSEELKERVYEIYHHLGEWLMGKDEFHLEQRYMAIGARRAHVAGASRAARPPIRAEMAARRGRDVPAHYHPGPEQSQAHLHRHLGGGRVPN